MVATGGDLTQHGIWFVIAAVVSCLSWKWRKRSFVKITERTYEKRAQSLHPRRKSGHPDGDIS